MNFKGVYRRFLNKISFNSNRLSAFLFIIESNISLCLIYTHAKQKGLFNTEFNMIGSNYPAFYLGQVKRRQREHLIILMVISVFLLFGLIILGVGYSKMSESGEKDPLKLVSNAYASVNHEITKEKLVEIIVPIINIEPRTKISFNLLTKKKIPAEYASNAVTDYSKIVGLYSKETLYSGQAISTDKVSQSVSTNKIIDKIPAGYRAVTITLSPTKSIEGWLQAGTSVDVYWISNVNKKPTIVPIVQNAYVISADRITLEDRNAAEKEGAEIAPMPVTASLRVTKDDALKIGLAASNGELTLSLRGDEEKGVSIYNQRGVNTNDLLHITQHNVVKNKPSVKVMDKKGHVHKYYLEGDKLVPIA